MSIRWNFPLAQVIAVGFICFCCPGMYNALNSGGGGQLDSKVGQNANVALYTCFVIFGLLAGAIHNKLGPKWTILIGCSTYVLYAGSLLCYNHINGTFTIALLPPVVSSVVELGAIMMAYPREHDKGRFIGYFWAIFNAGVVLGSVVAFAINNKSLGDSTYTVFISFMAIGTLIALSLCPPTSVTHSNGDKIQIQAFPTWTSDVIAVMKLFLDWRMIVLIPMFLSFDWFYSYQFPTVNGAYFSTRTQSLNISYWFSQIGGSWMLARVLDYQGINRKTRSLWGVIIITACFVATWIGGIFFQKGYIITDSKGNHDYTEGISYWLMGALSNDVTVLSRYAGFYRCIQSSGAAIAWRINAVGTPYMAELIICFALLIASLPGAHFLTFRIKDHSDEAAPDHDMQKVDGKQEVIA
ncbi:hypothetical protein BGW39_004374 [Mortierella sp. 14UC]|nr:hypothetical protein BGW39_004374 [Mortierella sp. 14UC]